MNVQTPAKNTRRIGRGFAMATLLSMVTLALTLTTSHPMASAPEVGAPAAAAAIAPVPAGTVTAVKIVGMDSCGSGQNVWQFEVNGVAVPGTYAASPTCTCEENPHTIATITDAAVLAAVSEPACNTFTAKQVGGGMYVIFVRAEIVRAGGPTETLCAVDYTGLGCADRQWNCNGYQYGGTRTWGPTALPDNDNDGLVSCNVDPDDDNDGILDADDNCSITPNVAQTDTDGNGAGDACDPIDRDNDGIWNINDNCADSANANQLDTDGNGTGDACQAAVVAVPWAGSESKPHVVYPGGELVLHASASTGGDGNPVSLVSGTWDPGDGSGPVAISVSNSRVLEHKHVYNGAVGTPYTATIRVTDSNSNVYTDTFKVLMVAKTLEAEANMAIDKGLWRVHSTMTLSTVSGQALGNWTANNAVAATAGSTQAFEINGHRETGDRLKDPYVDNVARGLRYLQNNISRLNIAAQTAGDPDTNGNGYGLRTNGGSEVYVGGQIVDAFVASGKPTTVVTIGPETGRTYADIVQDLMDAYSWGQDDSGTDRGGWIYSFNSQGGIDSSSSQWWAIGAHAADVWNTGFTPNFVRQENLNVGILALQDYHLGANFTPGQGDHGGCSYRGFGGDTNNARTASCLVLMSADGVSKTHSRFAAAEGFLARNFESGHEMHGNMYDMFALAKAMRLAKNNAGQSEPIVLLGGTIDWYGADPFPATPNDRRNGLARHLIGRQQANGEFTTSGHFGTGHLGNAYAIIILSPSLFEQAPEAVCQVDASVVCAANTPAGTGCNTLGTSPYSTVNFDGSLSTPGDNPIASYSWNFMDGSPLDPNVAASHDFVNVGTYGVRLTVTDTKSNSSSVICNVSVTSSALPPVADAGGPYDVCPNRTPSVILSGLGSVGRPSAIATYEWDFTEATGVNFSPVDSTAATTDQTAYFTALGAGTYNVGLRVTDSTPANEGGPFTSTVFTTVTVHAATDAACNAVPVATDNSYQTSKNNAVSGNVITDGTADSDPDGDTFTASVATGPAQGTLVLNANGSFTYTPAVDFDGTVTFTYTLTDQFGGVSDPATVTIVVVPNVNPVAQDDAAATFSGTPVTVAVLANDSDADAGQTLSVTGTSGGPANGGAVVNGDGTITYTPNLGFAGVDTFTYSISDGNGGTASATVTITVTTRSLTVSADSYTRSYLAADPVFAGTLTGVAAGDNITATYTSPGAGSQVPGVYDTIPTLVDPDGKLPNYTVSSTNGTLTITNTAPVCTIAPSLTSIWPPNHKLVSVTADGATDVDGGPLTYAVVSIWQDEPTNTTGDGNTAIDGFGVGTSTAQVRAERVGDPKTPGNGRVYHITFSVTDSLGLTCEATVQVGVPHDQSGKVQPVDGGALFDSTVAGAPLAIAAKGKGK